MLPRAAAATALPLVTGLLLVASSTGAWAGGSDAPVPYAVTADGLTLAPGDTFAVHDHVNVTYTTRHGRTASANLHIEGTRSTAGLIGKASVRWETVGVPENSCITWVQVSKYQEHFGEGGQKPVCQTTCKPPTPQPTTSPSPTPYPTYPPRPTPKPTATPTTPPTAPPTAPPTTPPVEEPTPEPTVPPVDEPTPDPTQDVTPTPEPTPDETTPAPEPSDDETPTPEPSLSSPVAPDDDEDVEVAGPTPTPTPSYPSEVLADEPDEDELAVTGSDSLVPGLAAALGAVAVGAGLLAVNARKRYRPAHRR